MSRAAFAATLLLTLTACGGGSGAVSSPAAIADVKTLDSVDPKPVVIDPPPTLGDQAPAPKPKLMPWEEDKSIPLTPADEQLRASLPFSPAIAMDPIDGSKISIRATTPTFEYKGKIYYFSSESNKSAFAANPAEYLKGSLTKL